MGLLKESSILTWEETEKKTSLMKSRGIDHFIRIYAENSSSKTREFLWGEEIEQNIIVKVDGNWILLVGSDCLLGLPSSNGTILHPEYAGYMLETTPDAPYKPGFMEIGEVEKNLEKRRKKILKIVRETFGGDASVLYLPCFPLLGTPLAFGTGTGSEVDWVEKWEKNFAERKKPESIEEEDSTADLTESRVEGQSALKRVLRRAAEPLFNTTQSRHFPDFAIASHKRFSGFTKNIKRRKNREKEYEIPLAKIEKETATDRPSKNTIQADKNVPPAVIDSMGQGMGCCCLQVTMQSESLKEARIIYDNIGAICPLLLFLTMGTPYADGKLIETSSRWKILGAAVDCRKASEAHIKKSRYSSIDLYVSEFPDQLDSVYNDISPPLEKTVLDKLISGGVDRAMARHIASLYIRDPILYYSDSTPEDDFENIQSSNWRSMRIKPPKSKSPENPEVSKGPWLVEVRPMEIQPTSFENTAYSVFVILFSRMVLSLDTNFYLPISKVDENFEFADKPGNNPSSLQEYLTAESNQEFWYRENIFDKNPPIIKKGTVEKIFTGDSNYIGILGAIEKYLKEYAPSQVKPVLPYLEFIKERVTKKKISLSSYIRKFISSHPEYKGDSVITQEVSNSLIERINSISEENSAEYLERETKTE